MRCTRPAPRSRRAELNSPEMTQPVLAAMRPASSRAWPRTPTSPSNKQAEGPPRERAFAAAVTAQADTRKRGLEAGAHTTCSAAPHAVSAGRIKVAIFPGASRATLIAAAASVETDIDVLALRTQCD